MYLKKFSILLFALLLLQWPLLSQAEEYDWVVGKWELAYDPDGGQRDYLEFLPNGDVISSGPEGEFEGFYVAAYGLVKAVITVNEKDIILSFLHDEAGTELRIVTSGSGRESIYHKVGEPRGPWI